MVLIECVWYRAWSGNPIGWYSDKNVTEHFKDSSTIGKVFCDRHNSDKGRFPLDEHYWIYWVYWMKASCIMSEERLTYLI